tara:strand:- start:106 stop:327 length:222 start_codon:yes stop_codon:yes gene_type:complete
MKDLTATLENIKKDIPNISKDQLGLLKKLILIWLGTFKDKPLLHLTMKETLNLIEVRVHKKSLENQTVINKDE